MVRRHICLNVFCLIFKVDRLITELKLPPADAYHKLRNTLEVINDLISSFSTTAGGVPTVDPAAGNVCFASATAGWSFTLQSFAKLYVKLHGIPFDAAKFAKRLWGDMYYHPDERVFRKKPPVSGGERSFVQFVLEPLYKIYSQVIGEHKKSVEATLAELGVTLSNAAYRLNVRPLLRLACSSVFGSATGFTDMLVEHIPSAKDAASKKVEHSYTGPQDSWIAEAMKDCDRSFSPDHYEGGAWNTGGSCTGKVRPALENELVANGFTDIMHEKQVTGFNKAIKKATGKSKLRLMDITRVFSYRTDGHPGPYRSPDPNKVTKRGPHGEPPPQDCLHWCMPGPVDTWNELVFEIIRREFEGA